MRRRSGPVLAGLLVMLALRAGLLAAGVVPFNSDEAVVALMARHILAGERPIFFYGQAYLGSLDAWLVAGAFRTLGEGVLAVRVVQVALYAGTLLSAYAVALKLFGDRWRAGLTALWLAVPPVVLTLYTTASLGGYGEALLIGNLLWWLGLHLIQTAGADWRAWLALGLLTGFGWWVFPLTAVYALPAWVAALWAGRRRPWAAQAARFLAAGAAALLGAGPWWWATLSGAATLAETGGAAIAGVSGGPWWSVLGLRLLSLGLFGTTVVFGLRPAWSVEWLALPLAPLALAAYGLAGWAGWRRGPVRAGLSLVLGTGGLLCAAFVLTPFGADPSGRYFLPLVMVLALLVADGLGELRGRHARLALGLSAGVLAFNLWGTVQAAAAFPPGLTTQFDPVAQVDMRALPELIDFLQARGETRGYTNYWVAYPLAFLSGEALLYTPRLPYHEDLRYTPRDDRYPPYGAAVAAAPRTAFILTRHLALEARLRAGLQALGVAFTEARIGEFQVFYALARPVRPEELGLGQACCP
ncbi:MAG: glycosyltransferase family 39 protein [Anaerolineales bacterium]|nr:glycosyltransferase family 39 protein [Anaerolineales bacterium]